jgi:hypothetical protein
MATIPTVRKSYLGEMYLWRTNEELAPTYFQNGRFFVPQGNRQFFASRDEIYLLRNFTPIPGNPVLEHAMNEKDARMKILVPSVISGNISEKGDRTLQIEDKHWLYSLKLIE